jgi:argininosuccinate lyase
MSGNPLDNKSQAWSALFSEPMSELVARYTASVGFDRRLARADIDGSLAHAAMLHAQGIIGAQDLADIRRGLDAIALEIESGRFEWKLELEDVHLNIEARLTQLVGDAGKRLHTGRSRNDQVATDVRLWLRGEIDALAGLLADMQRALVELAAQHTCWLMSRCSRATPSAWPTRAGASTGCRSALRRWQERALPSTAKRWPPRSASTACARTASTPSATATSRSSSAPSPRSRWSTSRAWPRSWCCG